MTVYFAVMRNWLIMVRGGEALVWISSVIVSFVKGGSDWQIVNHESPSTSGSDCMY